MTETEADQATCANQLEANRVFREARDRALAQGMSQEDAQRVGDAAEEDWWND